MVRRLLLLVALSMVVTLAFAPAALAQQSGGLCAGKERVEQVGGGFIGEAPRAEKWSLEVSGSKFQLVAKMDELDSGPEGYINVSVENSRGQEIAASRRIVNGEKDIITVNNGQADESYVLIVSGYKAYYDVTTYRCPNDGGVTRPQQPIAPSDPIDDGNFLNDFGNLVNDIIDYNLDNNTEGPGTTGGVPSQHPGPGASPADPNDPEQIIEDFKDCQDGVTDAARAAGDVAPNPTSRTPISSVFNLPNFLGELNEAANNPAC